MANDVCLPHNGSEMSEQLKEVLLECLLTSNQLIGLSGGVLLIQVPPLQRHRVPSASSSEGGHETIETPESVAELTCSLEIKAFAAKQIDAASS